ncbi:Terminase-like family protein [compost metagenome]
MARDGDTLIWGGSREEVYKKAPHVFDRDLANGATLEDLIKSVTFIPASLEDNKILQSKDPTYRANLMLQDRVERERLLGGNWKIRATAGEFFKRSWFEVIDVAPSDITVWVRYWDRAGTKKKKESDDPDWTAGVLIGKTRQGLYVVGHVERFRGTSLEVENKIKIITDQDAARFGRVYQVGIEQDPGQAGKFEANYYTRLLSGHNVRSYPARQDKVTRAKPFSAQAEAGNVKILRGPWNEDYLNELESFPNGSHDDQVDGSSGGFSVANEHRPFVPMGV